MKILLVDDDTELGTMLSEYLTGEGFDATLVLTGKAGVEGALSGDYTAMILDIMLPDAGGIDVLRDVRKKSRLPIIMLTAKGDNIDRVIGTEMGADDYMPKPCYPREWWRVCARCCDVSKSGRRRWTASRHQLRRVDAEPFSPQQRMAR